MDYIIVTFSCIIIMILYDTINIGDMILRVIWRMHLLTQSYIYDIINTVIV